MEINAKTLSIKKFATNKARISSDADLATFGVVNGQNTAANEREKTIIRIVIRRGC